MSMLLVLPAALLFHFNDRHVISSKEFHSQKFKVYLTMMDFIYSLPQFIEPVFFFSSSLIIYLYDVHLVWIIFFIHLIIMRKTLVLFLIYFSFYCQILSFSMYNGCLPVILMKFSIHSEFRKNTMNFYCIARISNISHRRIIYINIYMLLFSPSETQIIHSMTFILRKRKYSTRTFFRESK